MTSTIEKTLLLASPEVRGHVVEIYRTGDTVRAYITFDGRPVADGAWYYDADTVEGLVAEVMYSATRWIESGRLLGCGWTLHRAITVATDLRDALDDLTSAEATVGAAVDALDEVPEAFHTGVPQGVVDAMADIRRAHKYLREYALPMIAWYTPPTPAPVSVDGGEF